MSIRWVICFFLFVGTQVFSICPKEKPSDWDQWTFEQKIVWRGRNLDPRIPYGPLVDKLQVKKIVQDDISTAPLFFATNNVTQIFKAKLPKNFLMKANNASGKGVLVKDGMVIAITKHEPNFIPKKCTNRYLCLYAHEWLMSDYRSKKEKQYNLVKPMIFFEEYLEGITEEIELFVFNGKVRLFAVYFNKGYTVLPTAAFYDENWNQIMEEDPTFVTHSEPFERPIYLDKLIEFAERFTEKIDHVRIDFFVCKSDVYFGEFTFTTGGYREHLNRMIGHYWEYPDPKDPLVNPYLNKLLIGAGCLIEK